MGNPCISPMYINRQFYSNSTYSAPITPTYYTSTSNNTTTNYQNPVSNAYYQQSQPRVHSYNNVMHQLNSYNNFQQQQDQPPRYGANKFRNTYYGGRKTKRNSSLITHPESITGIRISK